LAALQIEYNLAQRTGDRELFGMAEHFGLGTMLYSPLAGGLLTGKYRNGASGRLTLSESGWLPRRCTATKAILDELETIATETEATSGQVALAWALTKNAFPIIGSRTLSHLNDGLKALDVNLTTDQIARLNNISGVTMGYPHDLLKTVQVSY
jgi:aryl-alcohol dehydrogenase-like predicted oxidoreductase